MIINYFSIKSNYNMGNKFSSSVDKSNSLNNNLNIKGPVTFDVSDVKPFISSNKIIHKNNKEFIVGSPLPDNYVSQEGGFVSNLIKAYNTHHHLVIRPDDVWIAILNVFQIYILNNAEKLR